MNEKKYQGNIVIGFIRSGVHPDNVLAYQKILTKNGIQVFGIAENKREKEQYAKIIKAYCFEEYLEQNWERIDIRKLAQYQEKYSDYSLWEIYHADRYIRYKYKRRDSAVLLTALIEFWEYVIRDSQVTYIVSDCMIGASNFIGMVVGKQYGVLYISAPSARYLKYYIFFSLEEGYRPVEYEWLTASHYEPTELEIKKANRYVLDYMEGHKKPYYVTSGVNKNRQFIKTLLLYATKVIHIRYLFNGRYRNKYNPHLYKRDLVEPLMEPIRRQFYPIYFSKPDYEEDYVLFPLHFQPEASTCVYARKYENQLFFIEQLVKSLPAGKMLYVKEHLVRQGHRKISFYRELRKYPCVKLISPDTDTYQLIKHCNFLVVLTSTMGYEALMYGKPVFVCGQCFYENFSGSIKIQDVFDEKEKFMNPPVQNRELYLKQMAIFLKTVHFFTTMEEPLYEETSEDLLDIQKKSMKELLAFIHRLESKQGLYQKDGELQ